MIDHLTDDSGMLVYCDFCVPAEEVELEGSWYECMGKLKRLGWKNFKSKRGEWFQKCPACVKGPTAKEDFVCRE